jgi:hypothetical protein
MSENSLVEIDLMRGKNIRWPYEDAIGCRWEIKADPVWMFNGRFSFWCCENCQKMRLRLELPGILKKGCEKTAKDVEYLKSVTILIKILSTRKKVVWKELTNEEDRVNFVFVIILLSV